MDRSRALPVGTVAVTGALALTLGATPATAAETDLSRHVNADPSTSQTDRVGAAALPRAGATVLPRAGHASGAAGSDTHVVSRGETITGIAIRNGLRTIDLLRWNDLSWTSIIRPGDELTLRAPSAAPAGEAGGGGSVYSVRAGDTLWSIAQHHGVSVAALSDANDLGDAAVIFPDQELTIPGDTAPEQPAPERPAAEPETHTVEAGDTLWAIAADNGLSVDELLTLNDLDANAIIYPGQDLIVSAPKDEGPRSIYDSPVYDLQATLNAPQAENARLIIGVARNLGVPEQGIAIALATAMVESGLRNLDWGDRDSVGLFQQRPSAGWGEADELVDRGVATTRFFLGAPDGSTRGLLDIAGWEALDFGDAAQAVQVSAFPDRYDRWRVAAWGWLAEHG